MQASSLSIEHSYFAVTGFSMMHGDIAQKKGFSTFEEALIEAKSMINYDENKCAIVKRRKGKYEVYLKYCNQTNPSSVSDPWTERTNIFYGKRMKNNQSQGKDEINSLVQFDYYIINNLDMYGADVREIQKYPTFNEAFSNVTRAINFDSTKCGTIHQEKSNSFVNYMKYAPNTNPSKSKYHATSSSVFFGRKV